MEEALLNLQNKKVKLCLLRNAANQTKKFIKIFCILKGPSLTDAAVILCTRLRNDVKPEDENKRNNIIMMSKYNLDDSTQR